MPLNVDNPQGELVIDPYKAKEKYNAWNKSIKGISPENERLIVQYLEDMRRGINIAPRAPKGRRGYRRLLTQKNRLKRTCQLLEEHERILNVAVSSQEALAGLEEALNRLFQKLEDGEIQKRSGGRYLSAADHLTSFKAFWHWYMVWMKRCNNVLVPDITEFLTVRQSHKPKFIYFGDQGSMEVEEGFRRLFEHANYRYRPLVSFLFDSGIRAPTELVNVKRKDITQLAGSPYFELNIRDETAKTYGRRIKLMLCHEQLRTYLREQEFQPEDFLFPIRPRVVNQYLKRLGQRVLGKQGLSMYDFRHNAVCYFLPRYKSENALMYRFGWKKSQMIHYYSEFLGMKDTLQEDDFLVDVPKTQIEKELESERRKRTQLDEELQQLRAQMANINRFMNRLTEDEEAVEFLARKARKDIANTTSTAPPLTARN